MRARYVSTTNKVRFARTELRAGTSRRYQHDEKKFIFAINSETHISILFLYEIYFKYVRISLHTHRCYLLSISFLYLMEHIVIFTFVYIVLAQ